MKPVSYFPDSYSNSYMDHRELRYHIFKLDSLLFNCYHFDPAIYYQDGHKAFDLKNLPFDNTPGFEMIRNILERSVDVIKSIPLPNLNDSGKAFEDNTWAYQMEIEKKDAYKRKVNRNTLVNFLPMRIADVIPNGNNLIIWISVCDSAVKNTYYYLVQEYTLNGKLLSQNTIFDDEPNEIRYIGFDPYNQYLLIFKKGKEYWTLEKRRWR